MTSSSALTDGTAVLGIDAAWTDSQPSGVALIVQSQGRWTHVLTAPSYGAFLGGDQDRPLGAPIKVPALLARCKELLDGVQPIVVAVDMPIGRGRIRARREAEHQVSTQFGRAHCAVHSPTPDRPGAVGERLARSFNDAGYALRFRPQEEPGQGPSLIEVYPHVALLALMEADQRLPYKCSKTGTYWRGASLSDRRRNLLEQWRRIEAHLRKVIAGVDLGLPLQDYAAPLSRLKAYEDRLDALICAWVGALYLERKAQPLGDASSAIWVPSAAMKYAKQS